jgi:hypothetical protein
MNIEKQKKRRAFFQKKDPFLLERWMGSNLEWQWKCVWGSNSLKTSNAALLLCLFRHKLRATDQCMFFNTATDFIDDDPQAANSAFINLALFCACRDFFLGSSFLCFLHSCLLGSLLRCLFNSLFLCRHSDLQSINWHFRSKAYFNC